MTALAPFYLQFPSVLLAPNTPHIGYGKRMQRNPRKIVSPLAPLWSTGPAERSAVGPQGALNCGFPVDCVRVDRQLAGHKILYFMFYLNFSLSLNPATFSIAPRPVFSQTTPTWCFCS
ncbi:hypothetical protein V2G26_020956 [Clonostachys chloroleuca]